MYLNQLWAQSASVPVTTVATLPVNQVYPDAAQMRAQFAGWKLSAIVAVTGPRSSFGRYLTGLLGPPAVRVGQILGWCFSGGSPRAARYVMAA